MPADIDRILADPGPEYQSLDPSYDIIYPLSSSNAFKTVNGTVLSVLSRFDPGRPIQFDAVDGGTVYSLPYRTWLIQLHVIHVDDNTACLRLYNSMPIGNREGNTRDYAVRPRPDADYVVGIGALMDRIHKEIAKIMQYAIKLGKETAPPPPSATDLYELFQWQSLYHPEMNDRDLAELVGLTHQAIRNARSKHRQIDRAALQLEYHPRKPRCTKQYVKTQRGRPRKK